jgi:hypothetical protein
MTVNSQIYSPSNDNVLPSDMVICTYMDPLELKLSTDNRSASLSELRPLGNVIPRTSLVSCHVVLLTKASSPIGVSPVDSYFFVPVTVNLRTKLTIIAPSRANARIVGP